MKLQAELKLLNIGNVGIHNLSPGMVTTELLMAGAAQFFQATADSSESSSNGLKVPHNKDVGFIRLLIPLAIAVTSCLCCLLLQISTEWLCSPLPFQAVLGRRLACSDSLVILGSWHARLKEGIIPCLSAAKWRC